MGNPANVAINKICVMCGENVASKPRTKDSQGRYYCHPCWASKGSRPTSKSTPTPVAPSRQAPDNNADDPFVQDNGWFTCPLCQSNVTAAKMDGSGVCIDCAKKPNTPTSISRRGPSASNKSEKGSVLNSLLSGLSPKVRLAIVVPLIAGIAVTAVLLSKRGGTSKSATTLSDSGLSEASGHVIATLGLGDQILRGSEIVLLKAEVPHETMSPVYDAIIDQAESAAVSNDKSATDLLKSDNVYSRLFAAQFQDNSKFYRLAQSQIQEMKTKLPMANTLAMAHLIDDYFQISEGAESSFTNVESAEKFFAEDFRADRRWRALLDATKVATATTDIDGKYQFHDVKPGNYILACGYVSGLSAVRWSVEVKVTKTATADLYNDNGRIFQIAMKKPL